MGKYTRVGLLNGFPFFKVPMILDLTEEERKDNLLLSLMLELSY